MRRITLTLYSIGLIIMSFGFFHEGRGELAADDVLRKLDQWQAEQIRLWKNGKQPAEEYLLDHITEMAPIGCPVPEHCKLNQMITIRKLMNQ